MRGSLVRCSITRLCVSQVSLLLRHQPYAAATIELTPLPPLPPSPPYHASAPTARATLACAHAEWPASAQLVLPTEMAALLCDPPRMRSSPDGYVYTLTLTNQLSSAIVVAVSASRFVPMAIDVATARALGDASAALVTVSSGCAALTSGMGAVSVALLSGSAASTAAASAASVGASAAAGVVALLGAAQELALLAQLNTDVPDLT
jgi:hypothetical protein